MIFVNPEGDEGGKIIIFDETGYEAVNLPEEIVPVIEDCLYGNPNSGKLVLKVGPDSVS